MPEAYLSDSERKMKMKLSVWSSYYHELEPEKAILRFLDNGIDCSEFSDEHGTMLLARSGDPVETGRRFGAFARAHGFEISQGHLKLSLRICSDETAMDTLFRWVDLYEAIGIRNMVLHCDGLMGTSLSREEKIEKNVAKLRELAEHIKGKDITICLENLRRRASSDTNLIDITAEDLLHLISLTGSNQFGICLDTGHLNLTEHSQREFILKAGDKLRALHIADNEGLTDQHKMPFAGGSIDFVEVFRALKEIGYTGLFNHEIPGETGIPLELRDAKLHYIKACYQYLSNL